MKKTSLSAVALVSLLAVSGCTQASSKIGADAGATPASGQPIPALAVDAAAAALIPADIKAKGVLSIGTDPSFPPYEFYAGDNKTVVGFDADIAEALGQILGLKTQMVPATFDTILPGLSSGKYDLGISGFQETEERKTNADFVSYAQGGTSVAVPVGNPKHLSTDWTSMCGRKIAAGKGTIQGMNTLPDFAAKCAAAGQPSLDVQLFPSMNDANLALRSGRVDGVMSESASMIHQARQAGDAFELVPGAELSPGIAGAALPKGSQLTAAVRAAMTKLADSTAYAEINRKWGLPESHQITAGQISGNQPK
jgi:polar amino acid transport system substrate-binding protein